MTSPTLHDDRVDTMRLNVMHRIDQDVRRRGRRARTAVGLSVAGVLVTGLGGYAIGSIDAGGGGASDSAGGSSSSAEIAPGKTAPDADREVVTTGSVTVTVSSPRTAARRLSAWVESIGGRVDDRSESGAGRDASASLTVRVPSTRVSATIERLGTYGTVDDVSVQNTDVTAQATDLDARIDALQVSIDRLTAIMAGGGSSAEVIRAEEALTQRQAQLESLQAERTLIADQVSLSTLSIQLTQQAGVDSVEPGGFTGGLRDGWNALVSTVNAVVEVAGVLLPWAAIAAAVGIVVLVVRRATRRVRTRR